MRLSRDFLDSFLPTTVVDLSDDCTADREIDKNVFDRIEAVSGRNRAAELPTSMAFRKPYVYAVKRRLIIHESQFSSG